MTNEPQKAQYVPAPKSEVIDGLLTKVMGKDRIATITQLGCMTCEVGVTCRTCNGMYPGHTGHPFRGFRDFTSEKEYTISGMCQKCQDVVWPPEKDLDGRDD